MAGCPGERPALKKPVRGHSPTTRWWHRHHARAIVSARHEFRGGGEPCRCRASRGHAGHDTWRAPPPFARRGVPCVPDRAQEPPVLLTEQAEQFLDGGGGPA